MIAVEGHLEQERFEHEGQNRETFKVVVDNFQFLRLKKTDEKDGTDDTGDIDIPEDDLPF